VSGEELERLRESAGNAGEADRQLLRQLNVSLRYYELEAPPQLHAALCNFCVESILSRRTRRGEPLLA
jgi:hypothetical protein